MPHSAPKNSVTTATDRLPEQSRQSATAAWPAQVYSDNLLTSLTARTPVSTHTPEQNTTIAAHTHATSRQRRAGWRNGQRDGRPREREREPATFHYEPHGAARRQQQPSDGP